MVAVERCEQPVVVDEVLEPAAQLDECEVDALLVQLDVELFQHVGRGDVDVGDRLALQDDPPWFAFACEMAHLLTEHAGIGEEQWRFPPEHDDAGGLLGNGTVVVAVPPRLALDLAEHLTVGPPAAPEEQQDRQHHGDEDALQHSEEDHTARGDEREHERTPADLQVTAQCRKVDE